MATTIPEPRARRAARRCLLPCALALAASAAAAPAPPDKTTLASVSSDGTQGDADSLVPSISPNGRWVTFFSASTNLVAGDSNGTHDVFLRDRKQGVTTRESVSSDGSQASGDSWDPFITPNGRWIAFDSDAPDLVTDDINLQNDVFVHDRKTGATTLVSVADDGTHGNGTSRVPSISANGRLVAFQSFATNLVAGDTNDFDDVFVRDLKLGTTTRISLTPAGGEGDDESFGGTISANGRWVVFSSRASNLVADDTNGKPDVFLRDLKKGVTTRESVSSVGAQSDGSSYERTISADGRWIVMESDATALVADDLNGLNDVFLRDTKKGVTTLVSIATNGTQGNAQSYIGSGSGNGRRVAFYSEATTLVANDTNGTGDIFLRDLKQGTTTRVSVGDADAQCDDNSAGPWLTPNGRWLAFHSFGTNLVAGDANGKEDVFVRDVK